MKLTASIMVTLDGVYQGPGGPDEDRRGGFDRGGWTAAHADKEGWRFLTAYFERADAFLLGRRTWEIWEPYWPHHDAGDPVSRSGSPHEAQKFEPEGLRCPHLLQNTPVRYRPRRDLSTTRPLTRRSAGGRPPRRGACRRRPRRRARSHRSSPRRRDPR